MKRMIKRLLVIAVVFVMTMGLTIPAQAKETNNYWLVGISKGAGGQMQMYYQKNSILLKGKAKKVTSIKQLDDTEDKKCTGTLKVANRCKIFFVEAENITTCSYQDWIESCGCKKGDELSFIAADIKVKNNEIVKITFSA